MNDQKNLKDAIGTSLVAGAWTGGNFATRAKAQKKRKQKKKKKTKEVE